MEERKERWPLAGLQGRDEKERAEEQEGKPRERKKKGRRRWHRFLCETWETFNS